MGDNPHIVLGVSAGTLGVLGLSNARMMDSPTAAHFLAGERCVNSCAFCSQACDSITVPGKLSRVTWPKWKWLEIREPLKRAIDSGEIKRVCIQTVESPDGTGTALAALRKIKEVSPGVPITVCVYPYSLNRVKKFFNTGADVIGLPIDAATSRIWKKVGKAGDFDSVWKVLETAAKLWPGRITTHFVAGLGESEEDMVNACRRGAKLGIRIGLFAFTPVRGTRLGQASPPPISSYRRLQIASFAISKNIGIQVVTEKGIIKSIKGLPADIIQRIEEGVPFRTQGCPGCNRPYYNERPGQVMMNFPRSLTREETRRCLAEAEIYNNLFCGGGT